MKKVFVATALSIASISIAYAADSGVYTSVKAGISDTKFKNSMYEAQDQISENSSVNKSAYPTVSAAVGFDFSTISPINARAELEYTYKHNTSFEPSVSSTTTLPQLNNGLTSQAFMLNGYYDFENQSKFTPYVSAGVGYTHVQNKQSLIDSQNTNSESDNQFTWSAGAGVAYAVSQNVALDLSYRYVDAGKFKFDNTVNNVATRTNAKLTSNEYLIGVRYSF